MDLRFCTSQHLRVPILFKLFSFTVSAAQREGPGQTPKQIFFGPYGYDMKRDLRMFELQPLDIILLPIF